MAGFKVLKSPRNTTSEKLPISSQTVALGALLERAVGATTWTVGTTVSNHFTLKAIADEAATTSATSVLATRIWGDELISATAANTADASHNGDRMLLTNSTTVNNAGSDNTSQNVCFIQEGIRNDGGLTKEIIGRIIVGNGVDPDAS